MKRWVLTALVCASMLAAAARADDLILNGSGGWSYSVVPFGQQPGFAATTYNSTGWQVGQGPWGGWETGYGENCGLNSTIVTAWPNYTDLLLRRSLQLCSGASGLAIDVTVDNDVQVFFNGVDISNGLIARENCAVYGEPNATFAVPDALLREGENVLAVRARDRGIISFLDLAVRGNVGDCVKPLLTVACTTAVPSITELWPPNHKYVPINVQGVLDSDGNEVDITIDSIFQDESVRGGHKTGSGKTCPDGRGLTTDTAWVRAERSGVLSNGRIYTIQFTATGAGGEVCQGVVRTCVPHDQGHGLVCIDDGALYDSTTCP
jgi:hypothetical protein